LPSATYSAAPAALNTASPSGGFCLMLWSSAVLPSRALSPACVLNLHSVKVQTGVDGLSSSQCDFRIFSRSTQRLVRHFGKSAQFEIILSRPPQK
jgi:hypothetical protein